MRILSRRRTIAALAIAVGLVSPLVTTVPAGAEVGETADITVPECTWRSAVGPGSAHVEWNLEGVKRVHVRAQNRWKTTVLPPASAATVDVFAGDGEGYFLFVDQIDGERRRVECAFAPSFPVSVSAVDGPVCTRTELPGRPHDFIRVWNTVGSLNLRDADGWVREIDRTEPWFFEGADDGAYTVVNRNPVEGKITLDCENSDDMGYRDRVYGGELDEMLPELATIESDWIVRELSRVDDDYLVYHPRTGQAVSVSLGVDWFIGGVSADGRSFWVYDSDNGPLERWQVRLDGPDGTLVYFAPRLN